MGDDVLFDERDGIATITLNRPERLNTIAIPTVEVLLEAIERAAGGTARVVVLAGNGDKFCAGADQAEMRPRIAQEWEPIISRYLDLIRALVAVDKPVVASLHGDAVGGGLGLAMACDIRIAAAGIRLGAPFTQIGISGVDMGAGWFLPRLVGLGAATELMFTGRLVGADEALALGLVHRVMPAAEHATEVAKWAARFAAGPPVAYMWTKRAIRRSLNTDMEGEFIFETLAQVQCLQTEDHFEGVAAFQEKRAPEFRGV